MTSLQCYGSSLMSASAMTIEEVPMRKVTVQLELKLMMLVDEGVEISHVVNELDYQLNDTTGAADVSDTEITDYELIDSK